MSTLFKTGDRVPSLAAGVALGLLGLCINCFCSIELIPGISMLLGSLCSMLALFRYGLGAGLIASLISSSFSLIIFNHPWAIVIFTAELLAVGLITRRYSLDPVTSCILYWLCGGELVSLLIHTGILGLPLQDALLIALKQAVNGVINVLLAQLINLAVRHRFDRHRELISMRLLLFYLAGTAFTLPVLFYIVADVRKEFRIHIKRLSAESEHVSRLATGLVNQLYAEAEQTAGVFTHLAKEHGGALSGLVYPHAARLISGASLIDRVLVLDHRNHLVAATGKPDIPLPQPLGLDLSDRPFIQRLHAADAPFVTALFWSKFGSPAPRIALIVPLRSGNSYLGGLICTFDFAKLHGLLTDIAGNHASKISLIDRAEQVIVSTRQDLKPMNRFKPLDGYRQPLDGSQVMHHLPGSCTQVTTLQRMQHSYYVRESGLPPNTGWRLLVETPLRHMLKETTDMLMNAFSLLAVLLLLTLVLAHLIARSMTRSLAQLGMVTEQLLLTGPETVAAAYPDSHITEVATLTEDLRRIGSALFDQQHELKTSHRQLQELTEHLTHVREEERKAIAREIHDELGMALTTLKFDTAWVKRHYGRQDDLLLDRLEGMDGTLKQSIDTVRRIVSELRPWLLDELGLEATMEWHLANLQSRTGVACRLVNQCQDLSCSWQRILDQHAVNLYRIFQEAVTNSIRYAEATLIQVTIATEGQKLVLAIADNGKGFSVADKESANSFGLLGMQERARLVGGNLTITSNQAAGTIVELVIPIVPESTDSE